MQPAGEKRVSVGVKRVAAVAVLIAIAVIVMWRVRRDDASPAAPLPASGSATATAPTGSAAAPAKPPAHVTQISPDERLRVADRIASAQSAHTHATPRPELPPAEHVDTPALKTSIRDAMREAHEYLVACYEKALPTLKDPYVKVTAKMTLTGDPDVGTLIDADQLVDDTGQPLPKGFDDCLRDTFQSLELPPLAEGDVVRVHYPFVFDVKPH